MPHLDTRTMRMYDLFNAVVYEVLLDGTEQELTYVVAVNTIEGWVEQKHLPPCGSYVKMHQDPPERRFGKFVVRDLRTGELWPE